MVFASSLESTVCDEEVEMRISNSRWRGVYMQASLIRSSEMAVQQRDQQLRHHDQQQQHRAPQRKSLDCTRHGADCIVGIGRQAVAVCGAWKYRPAWRRLGNAYGARVDAVDRPRHPRIFGKALRICARGWGSLQAAGSACSRPSGGVMASSCQARRQGRSNSGAESSMAQSLYRPQPKKR